MALHAGGCGTHASAREAASTDDGHALVAELAALRPTRVIMPRLSITQRYVVCTEGCPAATPTPDEQKRVLALAAKVADAMQHHATPATMHAAALLALVAGQTSQEALDRAIELLEGARRTPTGDRTLLVDLSAAYVVRGERERRPLDFVAALDASHQAARADPSDGAAAFDEALALDALGARDGARQAWVDAARPEGASPFGREARVRAMRDTSLAAPSHAAAVDSQSADAFAHAAPQEAAEWALDTLLAAWATRQIGGRAVAAPSSLALAEVVGRRIARDGGDRSVADAVAALRARAGATRATRAAAQAHAAYAAGRRAYAAASYAAADSAFRTALASRPPASLARLTRVWRAATLNYLGREGETERDAREMLRTTDARRYPAVVGRLHWMRATLRLRHGRYEDALHEARAADTAFARAHETANVGAASALMADAYFAIGDPDDGFAAASHALGLLAAYPHSPLRHAELFSMTKAAAADGALHAARALADADVEAAVASGNPLSVVEARIARARIAVASGSPSDTGNDLAAARRTIAAWAPTSEARRWFTAQLAQVSGEALLRSRPAAAVAALDSVIDFYQTRRNALRLVPALVQRANARLAMRSPDSAEADLEAATAVLAREHASLSRLEYRVSLLDAARSAFDRLVLLRAAHGDPRDALAYLERSRAALVARRSASVGSAPSVAIPSADVGVEYALIGDTLLVWTIAHGSVRLDRRPVDAEALLGTIDDAGRALALQSDDDALGGRLALMYRTLIAPIASQLGPPGTRLVIVADGELARAPFAAFYDSARRRYLVEDHPLLFAERLLHSPASDRAAPGAPRSILVISDPRLDSLRFASLERLRGADAEARAIRPLYEGGAVLGGAAATRASVLASMRRAEVVHFAGHAVFDDRHPERSYLPLAPSAAGDRISAGDFEDADLRGVRLIVLAGCRTLGTRPGHSGALVGFAGALVGAGAQRVIGSLWDVDDERTMPVMVALHRAYLRSADAARALQGAQIEMIHAADPALRSPSVWGAFRAFGG